MAELEVKFIAKPWWKNLGLVGAFFVILGLKMKMPLRLFYRLEIK